MWSVQWVGRHTPKTLYGYQLLPNYVTTYGKRLSIPVPRRKHLVILRRGYGAACEACGGNKIVKMLHELVYLQTVASRYYS